MKALILLSLFFISCASKNQSQKDACMHFCDINYLAETSKDVFKPLFKAGLKGPRDENSYAKTPLQAAILSENTPISLFLIEQNDSLNLQMPVSGLSPLMLSSIVLFFERFDNPAYVRDRNFSNVSKIFNRLRRHKGIDLSLNDLKGNSSEMYVELGKNVSKFSSLSEMSSSKTAAEKENAQKSLENYYITVSSEKTEEKKACWFLCNKEFMQTAPKEQILAEINNLEDPLKTMNESKTSHSYSLALMHALNRPEIIKMLIEHGAEVGAIDKSLPQKNPVIIKAIKMYLSLHMMEIYKDYSFIFKDSIVHSLTKKLPENFLSNLKKSIHLMLKEVDLEKNLTAEEKKDKIIDDSGALLNTYVDLFEKVSEFK